MEARHEWTVAGIWFGAANLGNAIMGAVWIPLGWGLRGSSYTPGRPTPEDLIATHVLDALLVVALVVNLGVPVVCVALHRWKIALGGVAAWVTLPFAFVLALILDAAIAFATTV